MTTINAYATIFQRNFTYALAMPPSVKITPVRYEKDDRGGPKHAEINVSGNAEDIAQIIEWLRCPVLISDTEEDVWWGYIHQAEIIMGEWKISASMDNMTNRVRVIYNEPVLYGTSNKSQTAWAQDDDSVSTYGTRELTLSLSDVPSAAAIAYRDTELAIRKYPLANVDPGGGNIQGTIICKGWMETLGWKYYEQSSGYTAHETSTSTKVQKLGIGCTSSQVGFSADTSTIHDMDGSLTSFKKDDVIRINGSTSNDGTYTVSQSSSREPASYITATIGFEIGEKRSKLIDSAGSFSPTLGAVGSTGWYLTIENSAVGNNGTYVVTAYSTNEIEIDDSLIAEPAGVMLTLKRPVASSFNVYTADTIETTSGFTYSIRDSASGMDDFQANDMITITGSASNSGTYRVESQSDSGAILVLDKTIIAEAAGPAITIARGSKITVSESFTDEYFGATTTVQIYGEAIRQTWTPSSGSWTVGVVSVKISKAGTGHTDGVTLAIYSDSSGNPGSLLDSVTIDESELPSTKQWVSFTLSNSITVTAGTTYHIVIQRSTGTISTDHWYEVSVDEGLGYSSGSLGLKVASVWDTSYTRTPDADLLFRAIGHKENTEQIQDILDSCGQFIEGVYIKIESGIDTPQFRDGRRTALDEIITLLDQGTSSGDRYICYVTKDRILVIDVEPSSENPHRLLPDNKIRTNNNIEVPTTRCITQVWVALDVFPSTVDTTRIGIQSPQYIQANKVDLSRGMQQPTFKGNLTNRQTREGINHG